MNQCFEKNIIWYNLKIFKIGDFDKDDIRRNAQSVSDNFRCGELVDITGNERGHYITIIQDGGYIKVFFEKKE